MSNDWGDRMIEYEEQNWTELAELFIEKNYSKPVISWDEFIMEEFEKHMSDLRWEPDHD